MYNLYKQRFGVINNSGTRVINSNEAVEEKLTELAKKLEREARNNGEDFVEGFVEGIGAEQVDEILNEPEEISQTVLQEEADQIIEQAHQQAEQIIAEANGQRDDIIKKATEEGKKQGYAVGLQQAGQELEEKKQELEEYRQNLDAKYDQQLEELEPQLLDVILTVFEKVFHIQFDDKKEVLVHLIKNTILNVEGSKEFNVRVCEDNYAFIEAHKQDILSRVGQNIVLNITADSMLKDNECMIETDSGIFDCSLGIQLENLIKDMKCLCL